jgi:serine/threonine-protein kinase HipA
LGESAIIAKLPSAEYPRMPQMEHLCMSLAALAGIRVCEFELHPLSALHAPHRYDLGQEWTGQFLAVTRFDRSPQGRIHFEDFAQALGVSPEAKYAQSYQAVAALLLDLPGCGEAAVYELIERMEVNDLLGNADMHLKNMGLLYPDGRQAEFAPAYDITSTAVLQGARGHALHLLDAQTSERPAQSAQRTAKTEALWSPKRLLQFCDPLGMSSTVASQRIRQVVSRAAHQWLEPILQAGITPQQRLRLLQNLIQHPHFQSFFKRQANQALGETWLSAFERCRVEGGEVES